MPIVFHLILQSVPTRHVEVSGYPYSLKELVPYKRNFASYLNEIGMLLKYIFLPQTFKMFEKMPLCICLRKVFVWEGRFFEPSSS